MRKSLSSKSITYILLILLSIIFPNISNAVPQTNILYTEEEKDLTLWSAKSYMSGDVLLRLVKFTSPPAENFTTTNHSTTDRCVDDKIRLRLVHLNSTVQKIDFKYPSITSINFCKDLIEIYPLSKGFIFLTFFTKFQETELNGQLKNVYQRSGLVVDWNEKIINEIQFGNLTTNDTGKIKKGAAVANMISGDDFIFANYYDNSNLLSWVQFSLSNNSFQQISTSNISVSLDHTDFEIFPTPDGGYGFLVTGTNPTIDNAANSTENQLLSQWQSKAYFLNSTAYNVSNSGISVYDLKTPVYDMHPKSCEILSDNSGFKCILSVIIESNSTLSSYIQTSFKSNGEVHDAGPVNFRNDIDVKLVKTLSSGSIFFAGFAKGTKNIIGQIYSKNGIFTNTWNYNGPILHEENLAAGLLPNNSAFVFAQSGNEPKTWAMITVDLTVESGITSLWKNHKAEFIYFGGFIIFLAIVTSFIHFQTSN
ncbi:hypothetical protein G9A89_001131, partial [Geosiphon pyriformis]